MEGIVALLMCCTIVVLRCRVCESLNTDEIEPFRMKKVNLVWQKAKSMSLSRERLNELYVELQRQDKDERKWKQQKTEGKDEDGETEAVLRRNLARIIEKYGIGDKDDGHPNFSSQQVFDVDGNRVRKAPSVKDERVDELWRAAVDEGQFSKQELDDLHHELAHHHEKWKQYNDLIALLSEHENRNINTVGKNSEHDDETLDKLREEMNIRRREVNGNYHRLKVKISRGAENDDFKDYRVKSLWRRAKAQNLPEDELAMIKEELRHFDHKISKHDNLQEQLDVAEELLSQGHKHIKDKHERLSSKVRDQQRYIKKLHHTLDTKIGPHNEL